MRLKQLKTWLTVIVIATSVSAQELTATQSSTLEDVNDKMVIARIDSPLVIQMLPAVVEPVQAVAMSVPVDGVLMTINTTEGDLVSQGQILAVIDNRIAEASVKSAEATTNRTAAITGAQYALESANRQVSRLGNLGTAVSRAELDQGRDVIARAKSDLELAHEQQRESRVQLELEKARLNSHNARAPFDGVIVQISGRPGQSMTRSDQLLIIANMKKLQADLHVPIEWFGKLKIDDLCELRAEAPVNSVIRGVILSIEPRIDAATKTFRCKIEIDNSNQNLPAGFSVRLVAPSEQPVAQQQQFKNASQISLRRQMNTKKTESTTGLVD